MDLIKKNEYGFAQFPYHVTEGTHSYFKNEFEIKYHGAFTPLFTNGKIFNFSNLTESTYGNVFPRNTSVSKVFQKTRLVSINGVWFQRKFIECVLPKSLIVYEFTRKGYLEISNLEKTKYALICGIVE